MVQKFPPPPYLASQDPETQRLNRWLLEIQSILNTSGGIDPASIPGLPATITQTAANTTDIAALQTSSGGNTTAILILQTNQSILFGDIATINSTLTTLTARNQVLNGAGVPGAGLGNNGDLYLNNTGGAGTRLYGKIAGAWAAIA